MTTSRILSIIAIAGENMRPSDIIGFKNWYARFLFDEACAYIRSIQISEPEKIKHIRWRENEIQKVVDKIKRREYQTNTEKKQENIQSFKNFFKG